MILKACPRTSKNVSTLEKLVWKYSSIGKRDV